MTPSPRNSMAAMLTIAMTAVIWVAIAVGVFVVAVLLIGLAASVNGGTLSGLTVETYDGIGPLTFGLAIVAAAALVAVIVYICLQLRRILSTLAEGDPFVPDNATRLTRIAIALGAMEVASMALSASGLLGPGEAGTWRLSINITLWAAVAALLILSQVFREGTRLREEEKMTI
ncbi:MAG: DUF2975 domain-containing protein [Pseudomonadota bacterium]